MPPAASAEPRVRLARRAVGVDYGDKLAAAKRSLFSPPRRSLIAPPLTPWPEYVSRSFEIANLDCHGAMWGPSEPFATGTLGDFDCGRRLHRLAPAPAGAPDRRHMRGRAG